MLSLGLPARCCPMTTHDFISKRLPLIWWKLGEEHRDIELIHSHPSVH